MNATPTTVLLAGDVTAGSATLRKWLSQGSCHCQFAASFQEACRLMSQTEFDLVLCQYDLPDRTGFPLLDWLDGSRSTLLFFARSGKGARWLPLIVRGKRCLDQPLLATAELPDALENMLAGATAIDVTETPAPSVEPEHTAAR